MQFLKHSTNTLTKSRAIEVSAYADNNGAIRYIGGLYSAGTAYPISIDEEGKLYSGSGSEVQL